MNYEDALTISASRWIIVIAHKENLDVLYKQISAHLVTAIAVHPLIVYRCGRH
jgi:hypothetical protein